MIFGNRQRNAVGSFIFLFYVFIYLILFCTAGPFGDNIFVFYVFTKLVLLDTSGPFGDPFLDCQKGGKSNQGGCGPRWIPRGNVDRI